jgi:hypothetical protein
MNFSEYKRLRTQPVPSHLEGIVSEDDLTLEYMEALFEATSHRCRIDAENDSLLVAGDRIPLRLRVDKSPERMFIAFSAHVKFLEHTEMSDRILYIMDLNADKLMVRHSLLEGPHLYFDYNLSYEDGILPQTILNTFFRFNYIVTNTLRDGSPDNKMAAALGEKTMLDISWE